MSPFVTKNTICTVNEPHILNLTTGRVDVREKMNILRVITVKPGRAFCPRIKIWFCCPKFEFILRSNFSTLNRKTDFLSQASISIIKFASITEQ